MSDTNTEKRLAAVAIAAAIAGCAYEEDDGETVPGTLLQVKGPQYVAERACVLVECLWTEMMDREWLPEA